MTDCAYCSNVQVCKAAHANAISKLVCEKAALEQKVERQHLQGEARSKGILEQVRVGCCHTSFRIGLKMNSKLADLCSPTHLAQLCFMCSDYLFHSSHSHIGKHTTKVWVGMVLQREREAKERAEAELVAARQTSGQEGQTALQAFNQLKSQSEVSKMQASHLSCVHV